MNTYQLWILNPSNQFQPLGPPASAVDANLWYQLLLAHFGSGEVEMRPVAPKAWPVFRHVGWWEGELWLEDGDVPARARITARSQWPGE